MLQQRNPIEEMKSLISDSYLKSNQVANYLDMSDRTFRRKMDEGAFDRLELERMDLITRLIELGVETFGSIPKFMTWMQSHPTTFNGKRPIELLSSQEGIQWVEETLYAIQHGLPG